MDSGAVRFAALVVVRWLQFAAAIGSGLVLGERGLGAAIAMGAVGVVATGLHAALRASTARSVRVNFVRSAAERVCSASALQTTTAGSPEVWFVRALNAGNDLIVEIGPGLIANGTTALLLGPVALLQVQSPVAMASPLVLVPVVATFFAFDHRFRRSHLLAHEHDRRMFAAMSYLMLGHAEIVASGDSRKRAEQVVEVADAWSAALAKAGSLAAIGSRLPVVLGASLGVVALLAAQRGGLQWVQVGDLIVIGSVIQSLGALAQGVLKARAGYADLDEFFRLTQVSADPGWATPGAPVAVTQAPIVVENVTFAYASGGAVRDLSFVWEPNELLALAGPNGSGKSTALRLLLRLGDPSSGDVRLGTTSLKSVDTRGWRRSIAYLPQRPYLPLDGTVGEAMKLLEPEVAEEAVRGWLDRLAVSSRLGDRYKDVLDAPVAELSAGERQRVSLARVLASNRPICLLDEPEANLDAEGVTTLAGILREQKSHRRILIAAHAPALLAASDRVVGLCIGAVRYT